MSTSTSEDKQDNGVGPSQLEDFEVVKILGYGSFGKVKLAQHKLTGYKVALKFISKKKVASPEMLARVKREIEYLNQLQHPHVIKLYDVVETPTDIIMVIEYLSGELFNYIVSKKGRIGEEEARRFFQQIISAVEYCHAHNIVHRDLKPENLLLDDNLNVKIADFGLSNNMQDGDFLKTSCGSPNYAAPEVISGKLYAGPEIDIWSCGVILYVLLCGRLPFDDDHIPTLFKKINGGIFFLPPSLSKDARQLLARMLVVDSTARIKMAEIRSSPWFLKNLPAYLQEPWDAFENVPHLRKADSVRIPGFGNASNKVLDQLASKTGLSRETLMDDLAQGQKSKYRLSYQLTLTVLSLSDVEAAERAAAAAASSGLKSRRSSSMSKPQMLMQRTPSTVSTISVLQSSLKGPPPLSSMQQARLLGKHFTASTLLNGTNQVGPLTPAGSGGSGSGSGPHTQSAPSLREADRTKGRKQQRWHFGIRSCSEPMEVMLEIYRTLKALDMQWRVKKSTPLSHDELKMDISRARLSHKEQEDKFKRIRDLYTVETRCVSGNSLVRIDLQLYRIDHQNYLVDFRNLGHFKLDPAPESPSDRAAADKPAYGLGGHFFSVDRQSKSPRMSSPYLFLEVAVRLIVELASPSH